MEKHSDVMDTSEHELLHNQLFGQMLHNRTIDVNKEFEEEKLPTINLIAERVVEEIVKLVKKLCLVTANHGLNKIHMHLENFDIANRLHPSDNDGHTEVCFDSYVRFELNQSIHAFIANKNRTKLTTHLLTTGGQQEVCECFYEKLTGELSADGLTVEHNTSPVIPLNFRYTVSW